MDTLELLDWDSTFFGFRVARILNPVANEEGLRTACSEMQKYRIRLAYWAANDFSPELHQILVSVGGQLVDEKQTFVAKLADGPKHPLPSLCVVEAYQEGMSLVDLKHLAVESGIFSRFSVDPNIPKGKARALFEEWIVRSVNRTVADEVLVIRQGARIAGMATLVQAGTRGSIGLIAVAEDFRGQKFGEALVRAAQNWWHERGVSEIRVVTQKANVAAQRLYRKCGFELETTEFFYHLWPERSLANSSQ